jgi:signal transduction histidine kinase
MWELHLKELGRLEQVAQRFLSFARPSPLEKKQVDLLHTMEQARGLLGAQAREQNVEVIIDPVAEGRKHWVQADEQQITQVLLNIGLNALQAMGESSGALRFSLNEDSRGDTRYRVISIENDGPVIVDKDLERIFDPFVTSKSEGVGLGLSIASRIVEQHGGFIEARNVGGDRGVVFSVFLPS